LRWLSELRTGVNFAGASVIATADGSRWLRVYGLTAHANILGGVIAIGLLLLATVVDGTRRSMLLRLVVFAAGVAVLFLTFSRSAWIGFPGGARGATLMLAAPQ